MPSQPSSRCLLAVDAGLRTGLACYGDDGRLRWYRSQHFANAGALGRAAGRILRETPGVVAVYVEGGGTLAEVWERVARRAGVGCTRVMAETWRARLLYAREQRSGADAKRAADALARRVIELSSARRPTALRDDAAEAILVGLWGAVQLGWADAATLGPRGA